MGASSSNSVPSPTPGCHPKEKHILHLKGHLSFTERSPAEGEAILYRVTLTVTLAKEFTPPSSRAASVCLVAQPRRSVGCATRLPRSLARMGKGTPSLGPSL